MSSDGFLQIHIDYIPERIIGIFSLEKGTTSGVWDRLRQSASENDGCKFSPNTITLPWPAVLSLLRQYVPSQKKWNFRFKPTPIAKSKLDDFIEQYKSIQQLKNKPPLQLSEKFIQSQLIEFGFTKRELRPFQMRDLRLLLALSNGANFSVPGAGKTTVTFALHLLTRQPGQHILIVGPKSSFPAWSEVIDECIGENSPEWVKEPFTILRGGREAIQKQLASGATRFVINYDQLLTISDVFTSYLLQNPVHLVLDESHRMKGGLSVKRGAVLINAATLPIRRDILSGTPMPQSPNDIQSQLDFLWPGTGLSRQIAIGESPKSVIGNLYVRTTKTDLGLPPVKRHFHHVNMGKGQAALYAIIKDETLRNLSSLKSGAGVDISRARRSVMRLLQLSVNPVLALRAIMEDTPSLDSGVVQQVFEDGPSTKMIAVRDFARSLAEKGKKTVIWSTFTDTIEQMERMLADLNPVTVYGAIPSGSPDDDFTREGRIRKFSNDPTCMTFIANPAAAGEGISLHHVCHEAIYLDRSYNSTHYLQSIDRIHRLGLSPDIETNIHIFQTKAPKGLGCIDHSVSRRLATKLRAMEELLEDEDLHKIALDEEESDEPIDYDIDHEDLMDLIEELEGKASYDEDKGV